MKGKHAGKIAHHDEADHAVVYLGEPIRSGYVLIKRAHLVNVTSLEHERWEAGAPRGLPADGHRAARSHSGREHGKRAVASSEPFTSPV